MSTVAMNNHNGLQLEWDDASVHGRYAAGKHPISFMLAVPGVVRDSVNEEECLHAAVEELRQTADYCFTKRIEHSSDSLRQIIAAVFRVFGGYSLNSDARSLPVLIASLAKDQFTIVASSAPIATCLWNQEYIVTLKPRLFAVSLPDFSQINIHCISARTTPNNIFIAITPQYSVQPLINTLKNTACFNSYDEAPKHCLAQIAQKLPGVIGSEQLLLGFSGRTSKQFVATTIAQKPSTNLLSPQLTTVTNKLDTLQVSIEQLRDNMSVDDRPFDQLLKRLQECEEQNLDKSVIEPLIRQLLLLYDLLPAQDSNEHSEAIQAIREMLESMLSIHAVEPFQAPGNRFDPKLQRCIAHEPTGAPSGDGLIAGRIRQGFLRNDTVFRPEEVVVWRYVSTHSFDERVASCK